MKQLCLVVVDLERIELVYEDIRSKNMLLNANQDLKLSDLDREVKIDENIIVLIKLFGRLLGEKDDVDVGTYDKAGARIETFVIGSIYYTLLNDHESYKKESWNKDHFVILGEKLQEKEFLLLTNSFEDTIIRKC